MAWTAVEHFDYTAGDNWHNASGGSGWSANWSISDTGAEYIISAENVWGTGSGLTQNTGGGTGFAFRTLTASVASGTIYLFLRCNEQQANNGIRVSVRSPGSANYYMVGLLGNDLILYSNAGNVTLLSNYTVDTWYEIALEFDTTVPQNRAKWRVYQGTWSDWTAFVEPGGGTVDKNAVDSLYVEHLGTDNTVDGFIGGIDSVANPPDVATSSTNNTVISSDNLLSNNKPTPRGPNLPTGGTIL